MYTDNVDIFCYLDCSIDQDDISLSNETVTCTSSILLIKSDLYGVYILVEVSFCISVNSTAAWNKTILASQAKL